MALGLLLVHVTNYGLIYCNCNFFQKHKIIPNLFGDYLSRGDTWICNKDSTEKYGWSLTTGRGR